MKKAAHDTLLEYEAPRAEMIRLGTEDILIASPTAPDLTNNGWDDDDLGVIKGWKS